MLTNRYIPVYSYNFDSTLGYPGEGPPTTIISYNINGAKDRLRAVLLDASRARVDAILLQEVHHYQDGWDTTAGLGLTSMCHGLGWIPFLSPGTNADSKGGTAVIIRRNSSNIKITENSKNTTKKVLNGRLTAVEVLIQGEPIWLSSIYLNASPQARKSTLDTLDQITLNIPCNSIIGGDFNCVANPLLDTHRPNPYSTYSNDHSRQWETFAASKGWRDAYRVLHKNKKGEYTRYAPNLYSRIDRIYIPNDASPWRINTLSTSHSIFAGDASSDHLPVILQIEPTLDRTSTKYPTRIDCELLRDSRIIHKIKLVWLKAYEEYPPNLHGALESFAQAKTATAHFLRQETRSKRESTSTIRALEKELDTHIFLLGDSPTQAALTTRERLLQK
jgi:exonuclease III